MPKKEQWQALLKIGEVFNRPALSERERLVLCVELTAKAIKAQRCSVWAIEQNGEDIVIVLKAGYPEHGHGKNTRLLVRERRLLDLAIQTKTVQIADAHNPDHVPSLDTTMAQTHNVINIVYVPMVYNNQVIGVLIVDITNERPALSNEDKDYCLIIANHAVAELVQLEELKIELEKEMVQAIRHNVGNRIATIGPFANRLCKLSEELKQTTDSKKQKRILSQIESSAGIIKQEIISLQEKIKSISAEHLGKLNKEPCDINQLVKEIASAFTVKLKDSGISLHTQLNQVPEIKIDKPKIKDALINLVQNSIDALIGTDINPKEITIKTGINKAKKEVFIKIKDGGKISQEVANQLFRKRFTTKKGGEGLGLMSVKRVVESHNGIIEYLEHRPTTTFIIWLPTKV